MKNKEDRASDYISIAANRETNAELVNSSDRVAGIIAASILDVQLGPLLRAFFIEDKKETEQLLSNENPNAPLSTLSSRARVAYCLGLIGKEEFQDISTVRKIRNICAHHLFDCDFELPAIKSACDDFRMLSELVDFGGAEDKVSPRVKFNIVVCLLDSLLQDRIKRAVRRPPPVRYQKPPRPTSAAHL